MVHVVEHLTSVQMYFLEVGHTKFNPDGGFGCIKKVLKGTECYSVLDLLSEDNILSHLNNHQF